MPMSGSTVMDWKDVNKRGLQSWKYAEVQCTSVRSKEIKCGPQSDLWKHDPVKPVVNFRERAAQLQVICRSREQQTRANMMTALTI